LLGTQRGQAFLRAETEIGVAGVDQLLGVLLIERKTLRLDVRSVRAALARALVPLHAQPSEPVVDRIDGAGHQTVLIGVFDAQDQLPAVLTREEVVVQGGADAPDMERAGGGGRETDADGHTWSLGILKEMTVTTRRDRRERERTRQQRRRGGGSPAPRRRIGQGWIVLGALAAFVALVVAARALGAFDAPAPPVDVNAT